MVQVATDEAEGAQALFCYIADTLGAKKTEQEYKPYLSGAKNSDDFFAKYKTLVDTAFSSRAVDTGKSKQQIIDYIKKNDDWFMSSLKISQYIITKIDTVSKKFNKIKAPGWQNLFYVHADDEIMGVMSTLFKAANEQSAKRGGAKSFGDINKWSPADIYFATENAKRMYKEMAADPETKNKNLTFAELNEAIGKSIQSGDLLPLSLKKVDRDVIIKEVNFSRKKEEQLLADTVCTGVQEYFPMEGVLDYTGRKFKLGPYEGGRDIYVTLNSGKAKGRLQFRHTPASNGKPSKGFKTVLSYVGSSALGGQVVGIPLLAKVIADVDKQFAATISRVFTTNYSKFETAMSAYNEKGGGKVRYNSNNKQLKNEFNNDVGAISALTIMNPLRKVISDYFKKKGKKQDNVVRAIFAYTASRTKNSAPFVIAKD
jgi:hypothetical protein